MAVVLLIFLIALILSGASCHPDVYSLREYFLNSECWMHRDVVAVDNGLTPLSLANEKWRKPSVLSTEDRKNVWKSKEVHGRFYRALTGPDVDLIASVNWLRFGDLFRETEDFACAIADEVVKTNNYRKFIMKDGTVDICRVCHRPADRHIDNNVGIIGGHHILIEKAPFMASLRLNGSIHWCGASIIHEQFVLTAAHCIIPNRVYKVLVGTDNINGDGDLFEIETINIHENFNKTTYEYDFCLIKLKTPLTFGPKVAKINLATSALKLPKGTEFNVTGWGSTGTDVVSPKLLQVEIPMIPKRKCKIQYVLHKFAVTSNMICAGYRGRDSCQGDSGGPLSLGDVQVGVTSFGLGCGILPGVYAKVSTVNSWIMDKVNSLI